MVVDLIFIVITLTNLGIFIFSSAISYNESIFSFCARLLILLNLFLLLVTVFQKNKFPVTQKTSHRLLGLAAISIFISYLLNQQDGFINFMIRFCGYLAVPIYIFAVQRFTFSKKMSSWFKFIAAIYVLFFCTALIFGPTYHPVTGALTLGYHNPNATGAIFLMTAVFVQLAFYNSVKRFPRWFSYIAVAVLIYLIILTQCRSAFLLTLVCFIYAISPRSFRPGKIYILLCLCSSYIFYYLYIYLFESGWQLEATILDRTIYSGRQNAFIEYGIDYTLFGDFAIDGLNLAATLINSIGIVGTLLLAAYYAKNLLSPFFQNIHDHNNSHKNLPLFCLGALFVHGCVEVAFFTAGSFFGSMIGCILAVIACNRQEILDSEKEE